MDDDEAPALRDLLNAQTGRIAWSELQRHFARGVVLNVAQGLDLVEVAARVAEDDRAALENWMQAGQLAKASIDDARRWQDGQSWFWAVVAAPWVLVQECPDPEQRLS